MICQHMRRKRRGHSKDEGTSLGVGSCEPSSTDSCLFDEFWHLDCTFVWLVGPQRLRIGGDDATRSDPAPFAFHYLCTGRESTLGCSYACSGWVIPGDPWLNVVSSGTASCCWNYYVSSRGRGKPDTTTTHTHTPSHRTHADADGIDEFVKTLREEGTNWIEATPDRL